MMGAGVLPFVHPGLAGAALIAGSVPVLIHLINRRRYRRVPWAAMRFLEAASRRSTRRLRMEQFILLAARVTLIVLLGMALARPFVPASGWLPLESTGVHRIVLLDDSLSMSAVRSDGRTRFAAAVEAATNLINGFPQSDPVSLVTLAAPASRRIGQGSYDRRLVREQVAAVVPTQRAGDMAGGLAAALELVNQSRTADGNRAVYIISDFQTRDWMSTGAISQQAQTAGPGAVTNAGTALRQLEAALPDPASQLILIPVDESAGNAAVIDLATDARLISRELPVRLSATIANFSSAPLRSASLSLFHNGRAVRREPVPTVESGGTVIVTASIAFSEPGTHGIEARLTTERGNVMTEDDGRFLSLNVRENRRVLLVDGRPGAGQLDGQAGFLAAALSPESITAAGVARTAPVSLITPKTILAAELSGEPLSGYDAIALCNVPRLSQEHWSRLGEFVRGGGGLLVFLGDAVNAENYNRYGHADQQGVIPTRLEQVVDVRLLPEYAQSDRHFGFSTDESGLVHPVVDEFRDRPTSGLFLARVHKYMRVSVVPSDAQVALAYSNGSPALIAAERGSGRVLLCTTTANMDWHNLPARGDYVSLVLSAMAHLSSGREQGGRFQVGQSVQAGLDSAEVAQEVRAFEPGGKSLSVSIVPQADGLGLLTGTVERCGLVAVEIGSKRRQFAVNLEPAESDLSRMDPVKLSSSLEVPFRWVEQEQIAGLHSSVKQSAELGGYALYAATLLLLCELWLGMHFASRHGGRA